MTDAEIREELFEQINKVYVGLSITAPMLAALRSHVHGFLEEKVSLGVINGYSDVLVCTYSDLQEELKVLSPDLGPGDLIVWFQVS